MEELQNVKDSLFANFQELFEEEKLKLKETYEIKKDLKEKEIMLAAKVE